MKKIDFFPREIETTTPIPFDQAWSRASKKVGVVVSIASYAEKCESGAKKGPFCKQMGIWAALSLSTEYALRGLKKNLLIRWPEGTYGSLSLKGLVRRLFRAFITDTTQISSFSFCPPYLPA